MAEIVFYAVPVSAFAAKVRIALDMKGLDFEEKPPPDGYGSPAYRAIVAAGSVPGLVVDGRPLHDSNAICEYLEEIAPTPPLLPADAYARARTRALLGFHDARLEAASRALFPLVKRDWRREPEAVSTGVAGVEAALERLEDLVDPHPFENGDAPTYADLAYPCTLQMAELIAAEVKAPIVLSARIGAWRDATAKIDAVARSLAITRAAMESWLAGFR